jgi:hypothetical protein
MKHSLILLPSEFAQAPSGACLYRLNFVGGPLDGAEYESSTVPEPCLQLASGPAGCATRTGTVSLPRHARYRLRSVRLVNCTTPVVACGYDYSGTDPEPDACRSRWWKRCVRAVCDWLEPKPRTHFVHASRNVNHVQD